MVFLSNRTLRKSDRRPIILFLVSLTASVADTLAFFSPYWMVLNPQTAIGLVPYGSALYYIYGWLPASFYFMCSSMLSGIAATVFCLLLLKKFLHDDDVQTCRTYYLTVAFFFFIVFVQAGVPFVLFVYNTPYQFWNFGVPSGIYYVGACVYIDLGAACLFFIGSVLSIVFAFVPYKSPDGPIDSWPPATTNQY